MVFVVRDGDVATHLGQVQVRLDAAGIGQNFYAAKQIKFE